MRHPLAQPRFDLGAFEVEEVARGVPDEARLLDGLAVTADLRISLEHEVIEVASVAQRSGRGESCDAGSDDQGPHAIHRKPT